MAETTHEPITNRTTVGVLRDALTAEGYPDIPVGRIFAALQRHLADLRGRWVAEALESAADGGSPMDDLAGDLTVSAVTSTRLRHLAAEYRAGTR